MFKRCSRPAFVGLTKINRSNILTMDPLEHKILKIVQINGPLEPEEVLSLLLQSLSLAEREEMEHPITLDQVRRILNEAASYDLVTRDTAGFKVAEMM